MQSWNNFWKVGSSKFLFKEDLNEAFPETRSAELSINPIKYDFKDWNGKIIWM